MAEWLDERERELIIDTSAMSAIAALAGGTQKPKKKRRL